MRENYLFVVNPIAGNGNRQAFMKAFKSWQGQTKHLFNVYETTGQNDSESIEDLLLQNSYTALAAVGGDGTLLLVAKLARVHHCKLALFPQGSANGMAAELQLPEDPSEQFKILERNKTMPCDMLLFNKEHWGLHISDMGINAAMVKEYEASDSRGFLGYGQGLLKALPNFEEFEVAITIEGITKYHTCVMLAIANVRKYGTGASINSVGKIGDGKFEVCIIHKLSPLQLAKHYFNLALEDSENLTVLQCQEALIKLKNHKLFKLTVNQ